MRTGRTLHQPDLRAVAALFERRGFLALAGALAPALLAAKGAGDDGEAAPLSFEAFLKLANPLAKELVADTTPLGQDRYLLALAALAVRLQDVPVPAMRAQKNPGTFIGANEGGDPFTVLHWRLEPGAVITDHPHSYGNVVTLLLEGEATVRNFEVVGARDYDATGTFRVRRTKEQVLRPGAINLVSLERDYTHGFRAGAGGARGLDITTRIRERQPNLQLELGAKVDEALGVFEARWKRDA
jgi:hypothetical protein